MKRVAIIADSHFDQDSRFEECVRLHDWIAADLETRRPDVILHAGDVYERKSTPAERRAVAAWAQRITEIAPLVIVRGNHDALGDLPLLQRLKTRHPLVVVEASGVHVLGGVAIAAVAWPRKAELLARTGQPVGAEAGAALAAEALRNVIAGLGDELARHDGPRVLLAHAMVRGSITSVGQPLVGCDMEIGIEDLALARADFVALGHIHKGQDWSFDDRPIVYPGSPRRTAFGEVEAKGYVFAEFDGSRCRCAQGYALGTCPVCDNRPYLDWERVEAPATPMLLIGEEFGEDRPGSGFTWLAGLHGEPATDDCYRGAEVRFRYTVAADQRDAAKARLPEILAYFTERGALSVKVEERVATTVRARAPEVAAAVTLPEKLAALWRSRGTVPEPARAARLLSRLAELEP